mgnify:CR=1 FL=1
MVILLFNRPDVTAQVAQRVANARPQAVYLVADGPRPDVPEDRELCELARNAALSAPWDCEVHTAFADTNMGLKARVSSGLDWVFNHEESAIILEDDCLADPSFFPYATELLERFASDTRVGMISGNNFLHGRRVSEYSYYFSHEVRIWGWATWRRVWQVFSTAGLQRNWSSSDVEKVTTLLSNPRRRRAIKSTAQKVNALDSWALPFALHCLDRGFLNVTPEANLVSNIGFGAHSTHTKFESFTDELPADSISLPLRHPEEVSESRGAGQLEGRLALWQWIVFPLAHPIDFLGRVWRYLHR